VAAGRRWPRFSVGNRGHLLMSNSLQQRASAVGALPNVWFRPSGTMCDTEQNASRTGGSVTLGAMPTMDDWKMKERWTGHSVATRRMLMGILERADDGCEDFSMVDRILFTACEFWVAVEAGTLKAFLGSPASEQLRCSAFAYRAIGAVEIAREVEAALRALGLADTGGRRVQCIEGLQARLRQSAEPTSDLIDRFSQLVH